MTLDRRTVLQGIGATVLAGCSVPNPKPREASSMSIALLHLAPDAGAVAANRAALLRAVRVAADAGARWVVTPELSVSGYTFSDLVGTDWIAPQPDPWFVELQAAVAALGVTLFAGLPERDPQTDLLHNTMFAIGPDGALLGRHRKVRTIKVGSEAWSSPGTGSPPVETPGLGAVGMLICADACDPNLTATYKTQGARLLVSSANWAPGLYGPSGEWEARSAETALPLIVCNRTGQGRRLDFREAESVVVCRGARRLTLSSPESVVFVVDWDDAAMEPRGHREIRL